MIRILHVKRFLAKSPLNSGHPWNLRYFGSTKLVSVCFGRPIRLRDMHASLSEAFRHLDAALHALRHAVQTHPFAPTPLAAARAGLRGSVPAAPAAAPPGSMRPARSSQCGRGALVEGRWNSCCRRLSPQCRHLNPHLDHISSPRTSNRACGFPALGSRSRSCLRPCMADCPPLQAREPYVLPPALVQIAHVLPRTHLVLPAQPLAQPRRRVHIERREGRGCLGRPQLGANLR